MFKRQEGYLQSHDGLTLFFQIWEKAQARGTVIITHGQGEHSECYQRLVDFFKNDDWSFWAWDMRGHGRSEGKRGYAASFDEYVRDFQTFLPVALADERVKKGPLILLSHSMGGLVQLKTLIEQPSLPVQAQVCSSPLLGISAAVPAWKEKGAQLMNLVYPQMTLWNELNNDMLTRDADVIREFEQDVLRHDRISPGVYLGFLENFPHLLSRAPQIQVPTLFQLAETDPVVSFAAATKVFEALGSTKKVMKTYGDGARHEIYNDTIRATVFQDLKAFLDPFKGAL